MKRLLITAWLIACTLTSFAQLSNLPTQVSSAITAFKYNALNIPLIFEGSVPDTISAEVWEINGTEGQKVASIVPTIVVSDLTATVKLTKEQVGKLKKNTAILVKLNGDYKIGMRITTTVSLGVPSISPIQVTIPDIGQVKINLIGDPAMAQAFGEQAAGAAVIATGSAATATTKAAQAVAAAASVDPKVAIRTPYGTSAKLRAIADTSFKSLIVTDKGREGIFNLNTSSSAIDDSSMVIVSGGRRYERVYEFVRPEYYGAIAGDAIDDGPAIQKALNFANSKGIELKFGPGNYITSITLKPKLVVGATQYNITITGAGIGITSISGTAALAGKNLFEVNPATNSNRPDSHITIKDITFYSIAADRIIYANNVIQFRLERCEFRGGDIACVQIGDGVIENYFIYIHNCYFNGVSSTGGQNLGLLRLYYARFAEVFSMKSDGGRYAIDIYQTDRTGILNCFLEGAKRASIYIHGSAGGVHRIIGNECTPYGLYDPNGQFDGTMSGMIIESVFGGSAENIVSGNHIYMQETLPKVILTNTPVGTFSPSPNSRIVTGGTSGATAYLIGYSGADKRLVLQPITGTFTKGETLTQATSGATATADSLVVNHTYGIQMLGNGGGNIIDHNKIRGFSEIGIVSRSANNTIDGNSINGTNGILIDNHARILGNDISTTSGYAAKRESTFQILMWANNKYNGSLINITP